MLVTQGLTILETHGNQPLQHLVNLGQKKITGALFPGENGMNTGLKNTKKGRMQHDIPRNKTNSIKSSERKSIKINLASLDSENITDDIFGMTASMETYYHISSDEIDRIFYRNTIHCTEVKQKILNS